MVAPNMPLTDTACRNAKPRAKTYKLFDGGGLYLEVTPKGSKWWRLKYRFAGKENRISLGVYPEVTLAEVRVSRDQERARLRNGLDPSRYRQIETARRSEASANSFEAIAREWIAKYSPTWAARRFAHCLLTPFSAFLELTA
jgi:hypothetical protein